MPAPPLTHHEILGLAAPFARSGRRVDLAASDRFARTLVFRSADADVLQLDASDAAHPRLTRTLAGGDTPALHAQLQADGADAAELLQRIDDVPPSRQVDAGPGYAIARSYRVGAPTGADRPPLTLTHAGARIGPALTLTLDVPPGRRSTATLQLQPAAGERLSFPDDLLAVLGWSWSRLTPRDGGWSCTLRLRGGNAARTADAERKLRRTAAHLAQTLAGSPAQWHERHRVARWRMTLRRAVPLLVCLVLLGAAIVVPQLLLFRESVLKMLMFNIPPLLLGLLFGLREVPTFEIPPLPRRPRAASWHAPRPADR